jgi:hypothetical protein
MAAMILARTLVFALALAPLTEPALAQPPAAEAEAVTYPDTPAGVQMAAYQKAMAAGGAQLANFLTANYAPGNIPALLYEMSLMEERSGGFIPLAVDPRSTPTRLALRVKSRNSGEEYLSFIHVDEKAPHRITALGMASGSYDIGAAFKRTP